MVYVNTTSHDDGSVAPTPVATMSCAVAMVGRTPRTEKPHLSEELEP